MIGTVDIKVNAAHPNMPLSALYTFLGSPQQVRIINVPKQIGNWKITAVQITVNYPDNSSPSVEATLTGGCWHGTLPAPSATGKSLMGFKITASGVDEHGNPITGYVLGKGDAYVLDDDATITVGGTTYYVHIVDTTPEAPHKGDLDLSTMKLWNGSAWVSLGADITLDDTVTETSANGVKSSGIWTWVKSLLPSWLTPSREEPPTQASVNAKYTKPSDGIPLSDLKPSTFPPEAHTHAQSDVSGLSAALGGKLDLTGGTVNGNIVVTRNFAYEFLPDYLPISGAIYRGPFTIVDAGGATLEVRDADSNVAATLAKDTLVVTNGHPQLKFNGIPLGTVKDNKLPVASVLKSGSVASEQNVADAVAIALQRVGSFAAVGGVTPSVSGGVAYVSALFSGANTLNNLDNIRTSAADATSAKNYIDARLPYPLYSVPSTGVLKDRARNTTNLASVTVPDDFTDLLVRASVTSSLSVTMPTAITTKYGDTFPAAQGEYLITITKTGAAEAYVRTIKLEVANA